MFKTEQIMRLTNLCGQLFGLFVEFTSKQSPVDRQGQSKGKVEVAI